MYGKRITRLLIITVLTSFVLSFNLAQSQCSSCADRIDLYVDGSRVNQCWIGCDGSCSLAYNNPGIHSMAARSYSGGVQCSSDSDSFTISCDGYDGCRDFGNGCEYQDWYPVWGGCDYTRSDVHTNYCENWGPNYCVGHEVWHTRTCHDYYCEGETCTDHPYQDTQLVDACDCWEYCEAGSCIDFRPTLTGCNYYDYCWDSSCSWGTECYTASTDPIQIAVIEETCTDGSYACHEPMTCPYRDTPPPGS